MILLYINGAWTISWLLGRKDPGNNLQRQSIILDASDLLFHYICTQSVLAVRIQESCQVRHQNESSSITINYENSLCVLCKVALNSPIHNLVDMFSSHRHLKTEKFTRLRKFNGSMNHDDLHCCRLVTVCHHFLTVCKLHQQNLENTIKVLEGYWFRQVLHSRVKHIQILTQSKPWVTEYKCVFPYLWKCFKESLTEETSHHLHYKHIWTIFGKSIEVIFTAQKSVLSQNLSGQTWCKERCVQVRFLYLTDSTKRQRGNPLLTEVFTPPLETSSLLTYQQKKSPRCFSREYSLLKIFSRIFC